MLVRRRFAGEHELRPDGRPRVKEGQSEVPYPRLIRAGSWRFEAGSTSINVPVSGECSRTNRLTSLPSDNPYVLQLHVAQLWAMFGRHDVLILWRCHPFPTSDREALN